MLIFVSSGGAEGIRTPYLLVANEALSLLSYSPKMVNYLSSFSGTKIPYSLFPQLRWGQTSQHERGASR